MAYTISGSEFCQSCHKYTVHSTDIFNPKSPVTCTICGTVYTRYSAIGRRAHAQALRKAHPLTVQPTIPCRYCGRLAASKKSPFCSSICEDESEAQFVSEQIIRAIFMNNPEAFSEWLAFRMAAYKFFTERVV